MYGVAADIAAVPAAAAAQSDRDQPPPATSVVKHVLSQELLLYLDRVKSLLQGNLLWQSLKK